MFTNSKKKTVSACLLGLVAILEFGSHGAALSQEQLPIRPDTEMGGVPGLLTTFGEAKTADGSVLRTFVTQPTEGKGDRHPILFTQWVSCGSVEYREGSGSREILKHLAENSGLALLQIERAGSGDSKGPSCSELDYNTEVAHYVEAYEILLNQAEVDASKVYVYGASLGSTTAPLVALELQSKGFNIEGVAIQGGGGISHYERMLNFDRIYLERRPESVDVGDILQEINTRAIFHTEYLLKGRHPDDVSRDSEAMTSVRNNIRGLNETDHYGRPFAWHQQATSRNVLKAWAELDAKVLVVFNTFEQFETRHGHAVIVEIVNRLRPGTAILVEQEGLGHSNLRYASKIDAYSNNNPEPAWWKTAKVLNSWFSQTM